MSKLFYELETDPFLGETLPSIARRVRGDVKQRGQKELDREALELFLGAHSLATGARLSIQHDDESPDFICKDEQGRLIGIEIIRIGILGVQARDLTDSIWNACSAKAEKVVGMTRRVHRIILVLCLTDSPLAEIAQLLRRLPPEDYARLGFAEIWVTDHSASVIYGDGTHDDPQLLGIFPEDRRKYYRRKASKPLSLSQIHPRTLWLPFFPSTATDAQRPNKGYHKLPAHVQAAELVARRAKALPRQIELATGKTFSLEIREHRPPRSAQA